MYYRITCQDSIKIYNVLEPLLADYRRLAIRKTDAKLEVIHMDEFVDLLLTAELFCGITLPRIQ